MDKKNFNKMMGIFGKVFEKKLAPDVLKIYFKIFKEIPDDKTEYIINQCIKRCRYLPRPADIFACLEEEDQISELPDLE